MTLVEFLTARLADDEAIAQRAVRWNEGCRDWATDGEPDWEHIALHDPARVLREVESKRQIIASYVGLDAQAKYPDHEGGMADGLYFAIACLALPYSDHPEYDETWKP